MMRKIGILCSGGDSPGMNPAIRALVRTAIYNEIVAVGIRRGYSGLLENNFIELNVASVGNMMQQGGTMLLTSRCKEFMDAKYRRIAADNLRNAKIDGLVVIGGNGSFNGAYLMHQETGFPVVGIPGTIDNDISGNEYSIGFETAVSTAVSAVDKIKDTAHSHERTFIVEVMGRKSPAIALQVGICCGAEHIVIPSREVDYEKVASDIKRGAGRGKFSSVIIVAEGETPGLCYKIQKNLKKNYDIDSHICILGHIQRGGAPSAIDRFVASQMGYSAIRALKDGHKAVVTAFNQNKIELVALDKCLDKKDEFDQSLLDLCYILAI
jgi:6-phosphofructokinase 1